MASPNKQLAAAIDRLADSPGVNTDQVTQLRESLASDRVLLGNLNQAAKAGQVVAFAMQPPGASLIGSYDIQSGVVVLPAGEFTPVGKHPTDGLVATLKLQDMSIRFGNSSYVDQAGNKQIVSQDMLSNLQQCINESPLLADQMKNAASVEPTPHLRNFAILAADVGAGATYDGNAKTMSIPAHRLQRSSPSNVDGFNSNAMTFTLAHETEHGFNHESKRQAYRAFDKEARDIARDREPINDYTAPIGTLIKAARQDEARAEIAGWNAVMSKVMRSDPSAGLNDMGALQGVRTYLFVDRDVATKAYIGKPDMTFKPDFSLEPTSDNIEAMGKRYFDRKPKDTPGFSSREVTSLGPHGEADYPNYYGRNAIERLMTIDRKHSRSVDGVEPQMHINMTALRLEERLIERLGLEIDPRPQQRQPYYDTSQSPPELKHFDHTKTGPSLNQHVPIDPAILTDEPIALARERSTPAQQSRPDHALYSQIAAQVRQQDQQHGRPWDEASERMTASLLLLAKESGLSRVDHVVFSAQTDRVGAGENVFIVQGRLDDPAHVRAHMKTEDAVRTPESVSFAKVEALNERKAEQAVELPLSRQMQDETQKSPHLGR